MEFVPSDDSFKNISTDSLESNACSPLEPDAEFLGILINAPNHVVLRKNVPKSRARHLAEVPLCGFFMFDGLTLQKYVRVIEEMKIVITNIETEEVYTGWVAQKDPLTLSPQDPPMTPDQLADTASGGYFNPDLTKAVSLPYKAAVYKIHVELETKEDTKPIRSNELTIDIVEEDKYAGSPTT